MPLAFTIRIRNKALAIFFGAIWFWALMIVAGQYNLATDPEYDSMAPAISIIAGWIPGLIYASLCVFFVVVCSTISVAFISPNKKQIDFDFVQPARNSGYIIDREHTCDTRANEKNGDKTDGRPAANQSP